MQLWNEIYFKDDVLKRVNGAGGGEETQCTVEAPLPQLPSFFVGLILQLPMDEKIFSHPWVTPIFCYLNGLPTRHQLVLLPSFNA